jgi:hypothetical protein
LVLVKSERLISDPWLLATYFATADLAERKFRFVKEAVRLNASTNLSNFNKAELSAQLASLELTAGPGRQKLAMARKADTESLTDPLLPPPPLLARLFLWIRSQSFGASSILLFKAAGC